MIKDWIISRIYRAPDVAIGGWNNPYLFRWYIIPRNRFFNIYLHQFLRDDEDRALHDHPWVSCSIILSGGYHEHLHPGWSILRKPGKITFRRATQAHRIELLGPKGNRNPAWTLFLTGPRIREWGFHCPNGWVHWQDFTNPDNPALVGKGCDQ